MSLDDLRSKIYEPLCHLQSTIIMTMGLGRMRLGRIGSLLACVGLVVAHGGGIAHQKPLVVDPDADWGTRHMAGKILSLSL